MESKKDSNSLDGNEKTKKPLRKNNTQREMVTEGKARLQDENGLKCFLIGK
tara:strand:+ start:2683 stop:2835 length:153 start_codon:yes stop_codon:yes gene_type:complete